MFRTISRFILLFLILISSSECFAAAEYNSLPQLDGKIDTQQVKPEASPEIEEPLIPENIEKPETPRVIKKPTVNRDIEDKSPIPILPYDENTINTVDSPQLDLTSPTLSFSHRADSLSFVKYQQDLNRMLGQLKILQQTIKEGAPLQLFSARVTNTIIMNELFKKKYDTQPQSNYESYRLVQSSVNMAKATRDFWVKTNKISQNLRDTPDKVIQTNFLHINTNIDRLLEFAQIDKDFIEE
jgi:hypothetical protein